METELAGHLKACADAYAAATGLELSTIAQRSAGDWRFYNRLTEPGASFTIRKYDVVMQWFSDNWPKGTPWPKGVGRPARSPEPA